MHYDVASKVILNHCRGPVLRELCGLKVRESELIDIRPQETASLRRSDFVLRALFEDNKEKSEKGDRRIMHPFFLCPLSLTRNGKKVEKGDSNCVACQVFILG